MPVWTKMIPHFLGGRSGADVTVSIETMSSNSFVSTRTTSGIFLNKKFQFCSIHVFELPLQDNSLTSCRLLYVPYQCPWFSRRSRFFITRVMSVQSVLQITSLPFVIAIGDFGIKDIDVIHKPENKKSRRSKACLD
ncbi:MAG: hypothetical protein ACJAVY_000846 [Marinoscillum sp.]|jgi:hypothetical protein